MKNKNFLTLLLATGMVALLCTANAQSVFNVTSGAWNVATNWSPSGIPNSANDVVIPAGTTCTGLGAAEACASLSIGGSLTLNGFAFSVTGETFVTNAATLAITSATGAKTFLDITIQSGGYFDGTANGALCTISGSITNDGMWNAESGGQSAVYTLAGAGNTISGSGTYSNQSVTVTGNYTIQPGVQFWMGVNSAGSGHLTGTGVLTNEGTLIYRVTAVPTIATLNCSTAGNTFIWTNINATITPIPISYYNLVLGNLGTSGANLNGAGLSIANNFTLTGAGNISSWPANDTIGGTFTYSTSSGTASTFPAALSIGGFSQTSGKLALPANSILTVTGTGPGIWAPTGGTLTQNASSTVEFTGAAPGFGGNFANLIIAATATDAAATSLVVTNTLTVSPGALLDVTALSGSTYSMLGAGSLINSGTINGSVATVSGSKIFSSTTGGYGTNDITGSLTLATGSTVGFDINSTAAAGSDLLTVGGTLTLNNTVFNLKAPSSGATIDTANDYTLVTAGSISGTPVLNWVTGFVPANNTNYSLVVNSGSINLHYTASTVTTPPTNAPTLTATVSGNQLTLSWDSTTYPGYSVDVETNSDGVGADWIELSGTTTSPYITTIDPTQPAVFYRLSNP